MKSLTRYLTLNVPSKMAFRNITPEVDEVVRASGVQEGLGFNHCPHEANINARKARQPFTPPVLSEAQQRLV